MTYTLMYVIMVTSRVYIQDTGLSLHTCVGRAAMARTEMTESGLLKIIGDVRYFCMPENKSGGE